MQILLGLVQFGFVVTYLSEPLVRGYTSAAAIHVTVSQLKSILGVEISQRSHPLSLIYVRVHRIYHTTSFKKMVKELPIATKLLLSLSNLPMKNYSLILVFFAHSPSEIIVLPQSIVDIYTRCR